MIRWCDRSDNGFDVVKVNTSVAEFTRAFPRFSDVAANAGSAKQRRIEEAMEAAAAAAEQGVNIERDLSNRILTKSCVLLAKTNKDKVP